MAPSEVTEPTLNGPADVERARMDEAHDILAAAKEATAAAEAAYALAYCHGRQTNIGSLVEFPHEEGQWVVTSFHYDGGHVFVQARKITKTGTLHRGANWNGLVEYSVWTVVGTWEGDLP